MWCFPFESSHGKVGEDVVLLRVILKCIFDLVCTVKLHIDNNNGFATFLDLI